MGRATDEREMSAGRRPTASTAEPAPGEDRPSRVFVARQPILDRQLRVSAYELLFRSGDEAAYSHPDGDVASQSVVNSSLHVFGLDDLTQGRPVFINFTRALLVEQLALLLPSDKVIVEILETVAPDEAVLRACQELKRGGYLLALDDFAGQPECEPFTGLVDVVKLDFLRARGAERRKLVERLRPRRVKLLAEKVETREDFAEGLALGCDYFQGYFFCKPEIVSREDVPGNKLAALRFLRELNQPEIDFTRLERLVKQDVALPVKLLRYVNSAWFGLAGRVDSLRHALVMLGIQGLRQWASLVVIADLGRDRSPAVVTTCLVRAAFCERLAPQAGFPDQASNLFLIGLFSTLDVLVGRPLDELLGEVAVPEAVREALLGRPSPLSAPYSLALAYERAEWESAAELAGALCVEEESLAYLYRDAIRWVNQILTV